MKKRMLAALLALFMVLGLFNAGVLAEPLMNAAEDAALEAGIYTIRSVKAPSIVWSVPDGVTADTELVLEEEDGSREQKFVVTPLGGGLYAITNYATGMSLDIPGQSTAKRTLIHQHRCNQTVAQQFRILRAEDGSLQILPAYTDLVFDVKDGLAEAGGRLQIYKANGTEAQYFIFEKAEPEAMAAGYYLLRSASSPAYVLTIGGTVTASRADVRLETYRSSAAQKFVVSESREGFLISPAASWLALDVRGGTMASGTAVQQYVYNDTIAQKWQFIANDDGTFSIISSKDTSYYLTMGQAGASSAVTIEKKLDGSDAARQKFRPELFDGGRTMPDGAFSLASYDNTGLVLDVAGGSYDNRANIQLYKSNDTNAQKFYCVYQGDGLYSLKNAKSGKVLDVSGGSTADRTNVQQYKPNGTPAQKWRFVSAGGGAYYLTSALNDASRLDIAHGQAVSKANIQLYHANSDSNAQLFVPIPVKVVPEKARHKVAIDAGHQGILNTGTEPIGPGSTTMKRKVTTGTHGNWSGLDESVLNLQVALKLKAELIARGYDVYMIRESQNVNISNAERAQLATQAGAEILVRIHANSSTNASVRGAMAYQPSSSNPFLSASVIAGSQRLTSLLLQGECAVTGLPNRGILTGDDMTGINWSTMPVSIIEMGFMSNREDDLYMASGAGQNAIVKGLANGIDAYFG